MDKMQREQQKNVTYLEAQLEAHRAMISVAISTSREEMARLEKFLKELEKHDKEKHEKKG